MSEQQECPCGRCVTCACGEIPRMDEDGACARCGGTPYVSAATQGTPHLGSEVEDGQEAKEIQRMIDDPIIAMRADKWLNEYRNAQRATH
jgi:hypothetical protein